MDIPTKESFTGINVTEIEFRTSMDSLIDFLSAIIGTVSDYIKIPSGTGISRPVATSEPGWLRINSTDQELEVTHAVQWKRIIMAIADPTWRYLISSGVTTIMKWKNILGANAEIAVGNNSTQEVKMGVSSTDVYLKSSTTIPVRIHINGVPVFKLDSAGNLTTIGTITQKGTV